MELPSFIFPLLKRFRLPPRLHWLAANLINPHFLLGVAGIITDEQGRLLLFHHTYRRSHPWGMPGGWMSKGESPLETLEREVHEESGLQVRAERLALIGVTRDRPKFEFVVCGKLVGGTFQASREVDQMGWFAPDQYPALAPFHQHILQQWRDQPNHEVGWYEAPWIIAHPR